MSAELIFSICNLAVIPGWLLLLVLPRWKWTLGLISAGVIPFILGLVYGALLLGELGSLPEGGGFGSLQAIGILFSDPNALLVGWIHYLAFDLFIGAWEVQDAQKHKVPHWMVIPCMLLTFLAGPVGLTLYLAIRVARTRQMLVYS